MATKKKVEATIVPHPDLPVIKFRIGQTVWRGVSVWNGEDLPCKVCEGKGQVKATVTGSDHIVTVSCPVCFGKGHKVINYGYKPNVEKMRIGLIEVRSSCNKNKVSENCIHYMMHEYGIGGGTLFNQDDLSETEEEANKVAKKRAQTDIDKWCETHQYDSESETWIKF
jgi:hypothetical protein